MITGNEPAMPAKVDEYDNFLGDITTNTTGLTIRQQFASTASVDFGDWPLTIFCQVLGYKPDYYDNLTFLEKYLFWIEAEAKVKVMKADALINELNKQP